MKLFDDDRFLSQSEDDKLCEHPVKTAPRESFGKVPPEWIRERKGVGDGGKIEWISSVVNTRAVFRGQNELIGEFKMAESDMTSFFCYILDFCYILSGHKYLFL